METQQIYMITEAGIKVLTDQITEKILGALNSSKTSDEEKFLTIEETAEMINLTKPTVYGLVHRNRIPFIKKGKRLYFEKIEIINWIKGGKKKSKSDIEIKADEYLSKNRLY